jgi:signal peptidase I
MSNRELNGADFRELARNILRNGHQVHFRARGGSMYPFIKDGDVLEVTPYAEKLIIRCGDVLLIETNTGKFLTHRVVNIKHHHGKDYYMIKSDASDSTDGWFRSENILGRVDVIERGSRRIWLTLPAQQWKASVWVMLAPWVPRFSWLPGRIRERVKHWLLMS